MCVLVFYSFGSMSRLPHTLHLILLQCDICLGRPRFL